MFAGDAGPAAAGVPRPVGDQHRLLPVGHLDHGPAVGIDDERRAVECQLVLPADPIEIGQRKAGGCDPAFDQVPADVVLVELIGTAVGDQQQFGTGIDEVGADVVEPDILADRKTDPDPAKGERLGQRPGGEHPLFIEGAVVGEFALEADEALLAVLGDDHRIVGLAPLDHDRAEHERGPRPGGCGDQSGSGLGGSAQKLGVEDEVFGRVAG